jgi:putative RecB family exonuclease
MPRVQSPSSINTYKQCPRKYYYSYIEKLPTKPSIHLVRGTVVHETLEYFFERPILQVADMYTNLQFHILTILKERWVEHDGELQVLGMPAVDLDFYKEETLLMIMNWLAHFWRNVQTAMSTGMSFEDAFQRFTPRREEEYASAEYKVRGFIDAIHERDNEVHIRDYKTSKHPVISEEYRLQLAIYALLYNKTHGVLPTTVGIFFLKHGELLLEVNDELLKHADLEIRWVHERTQTDDLRDYPKKPSPLCNYCDFYDACWKQRELTDF